MSNIIVRVARRLKNDPKSVWIHIFRSTIGKLFPDKKYIEIMYYIYLKEKLNVSTPQTFNEKLQWLKLHDRNPEYTTMVDKYAAKKWVADRIGKEYIIPTLGVWNHFDDIDFETLPDQFVLKCTHDSGGLVIVKDKSQLDKMSAKRKIEQSLKRNYYWVGREWPYKDVPPRIIAEPYMSNNSVSLPENLKIENGDESKIKEFNELKDGLTDYKIYCFNGKAKLMMVASNRFSDEQTRFDYFDREGKWLDLVWGNPRSETEPNIDVNMEELFKTAEKLATGIPHVRVDLYYSNGQIYFGEMTFYDASGFGKIESEGWDEMLGDWIELPISSGGGYTVIDGITVFINYACVPTETDLRDYKFYCFNGNPEYCQVISNRSENETIDFYDMDWNHQEFTGLALPHKPFSKREILKPVTFENMKRAAVILSKGTPFLRVDFYEVKGKMYFGELTFYPASGFGELEPKTWNNKLGDMIILPTRK